MKHHNDSAISFFLRLAVTVICLGCTCLEAKLNVLVFAPEDKWHSSTLEPAKAAFEKLAFEHDLELHWTQNPHFFSDSEIPPFEVLLFLHGNVTAFTESEKQRFQAFIQHGGGFVGIHATITHGAWDWYHNLIGREFVFHPFQQTAVVNTTDNEHPSTLHFTEKWLWHDEFYIFSTASSASHLQVLLSVDPSSYDPVGEHSDKLDQCDVIGSSLPLAWCHPYDGGRVFYTALGHRPEHYENPLFQQHLLGAIIWAAQKDTH